MSHILMYFECVYSKGRHFLWAFWQAM